MYPNLRWWLFNEQELGELFKISRPTLTELSTEVVGRGLEICKIDYGGNAVNASKLSYIRSVFYATSRALSLRRSYFDFMTATSLDKFMTTTPPDKRVTCSMGRSYEYSEDKLTMT
ncbi:MAG: hypothetical protein ACTS6G_06375 [Candidatus Hodgkinia cicadicola]